MSDLNQIALLAYNDTLGRRYSVEEWLPRSDEGPDGPEVVKDQEWFWNFEGKEDRSITYLNSKGDAHSLNAYLIKGNTNKAIILSHGITGCSRMMGNFVKPFFDLGFTILTPDLRGHGRNDENIFELGIYSSKDYISWANMLISELGSNLEIYLFGVSLGGAIVLGAVGGSDVPSNIKNIIIDASPIDMQYVGRNLLLSNQYLAGLQDDEKTIVVDKVNDLFFSNQGCRIEQSLNAMESLTRQQQLLVIHGRNDTSFPLSVNDNFLKYYWGATKGYFYVEGANHPQSMWYDYQGYISILKHFVDVCSLSSPLISGVIEKAEGYYFAGEDINLMDGVMAYDKVDKDITAKVTTVGSVDINAPGEYTISYKVENSSGMSSEISTIIYIQPAR